MAVREDVVKLGRLDFFNQELMRGRTNHINRIWERYQDERQAATSAEELYTLKRAALVECLGQMYVSYANEDIENPEMKKVANF